MFLSFRFMFFIVVVYLVFFLIPAKGRYVYLTMVSALYLYSLSRYACLIAIAVAFYTGFAGFYLGKRKEQNKWIFMPLIAVLLLILFIFKWERGAAIPIGLSFYCFQSIAYLTDLYWGKIKNPLKMDEVFLSMLFFPKIVSGPIERVQYFSEVRERVEKLSLGERLCISRAVNYFLCGTFLKMGIADRCGILVDFVYDNIEVCDSILLLLNTIVYSVQIYCDFSGYILMAIGIGNLFGFHMTDNFKTPYLAQNITDFWKRWHITLSSFLKTYLYIPLGGNRRGRIGKWRNVMVVFLLCGLWHGIGLKYLVWGALHGIYSGIETIIKVKSRVFTFVLVTFAWIFFRASGLREALRYLKGIVFNGFSISKLQNMLEKSDFWGIEGIVLLISIITLLYLEILAYRKQKTVAEYLLDRPRQYRFMIYYLMIIYLFVFGIYGHGFMESSYIYMQF